MAPATILIIDDEKAIRRMLRLSLEAHGYQVSEAATAREGLREAVHPLPDVILLDLVLPDAPGLEVLRRIREFSQTPILVLSALSSDREKTTLLDAGADDYLTKPFSMPELLARIRVALRHTQRQRESGVDEDVFEAGALRLERSSRTVSVDGRPVRLTPTEYALLAVFAQYAGRVLTHAQIIQQVWGTELNEMNALRVHVAQLRKKIRGPGSPEIETVPGVGYRLVRAEDQ